MSKKNHYTLIFDGGSLGNPGRGYGSFRWRRDDGPWSEPVRLEFGDRVTNNEAEYRSFLGGLEALGEVCGDPASTEVEVLSDSRLVIEQMQGHWKLRAANLVPLHATGCRLVGAFAKVRFTWQPRSRVVALLGH
jgi:ribonuclease HI